MINRFEQKPSVLMLDSGVGGLSLYSNIRASLPGISIHYVGDNAALPYGEKTDQFILNRVVQLTRHYELQLQPLIIILACNTASTLALPELRAATNIPIVGVVPAIKVAGEISTSRRIGLLATPATIERLYIDELMNSFAHDCHLVRVGSSLMVNMAESKLAGNPVDMHQLHQEIWPFIEQGVDSIVLGCTHFPILKAELQQLAPSLNWIDSGEAIASRTEHLIGEYYQHDPKMLLKLQTPNQPNTQLNNAYFTGAVSISLKATLIRIGFGLVEDHQAKALGFDVDEHNPY